MQQYEQIVDDILAILMADVDPSDAALRDVDTRYSDAVAEINERLVACDKLLHKGHRAEAIQECEREPNLLDALAVLDFPEAEQWGEYVRQFGLAGPPTLRSDIALDLNDAYTTDSDLGDILQQHRLLALARAPLGTRLKVLRQIARQDAGNPIWLDDVRSWERVRHSQLPRELEGAVANDDLSAIAHLVQEVRSRDWLTPPPDALVNRIAESHQQICVKQARRQLEVLEKELTKAYADCDVHRARRIREQWKACATVGIARDDDPLVLMATPALEWLSEQDRQDREQSEYVAALAALESALDTGASQQELERLTHAVLGFEQGLPESLEQRLQKRFADLEKAKRRKTAVVLTSIVMSVLLLAGLTAWAIHSYGRSKLLAGHDKNLKDLIEARRLDAARSYADDVQKNAPSLYGTPNIQNRIKALEAAELEEQTRRDRFAALLQDARTLWQTSEGQWQAEAKLGDADKLMGKAPESRQHTEAQELDKARGELGTSRSEQQSKINETWVTEYRAWRQPYEQLDSSDPDEIERLLRDGEALAKRSKVDSQVRNQIQPQLEELRKGYEKQALNQTESELMQRVTDAVGDRSKYARSLQAYIEKLPQKPRAGDFKQILDNESSSWDGIEAWEQLTARWSTLQLNRISAAQAGKLIAEAEPLLQQHPGFPAAASVQPIVEFLRPIRARMKEDGTRLDSSLIPDLDVPPVKDFHIVWHSPADGPSKRYYFLEKSPQVLARTVKLEHLVNNLGEVRQVDIPRLEVKNPEEGKAFNWTSPQQQFYDFLVEQLPKLDDANWESTFFGIIQQLYTEPQLAPNFRMEPILKIELLDRLLQTACEGSYAVQRGFGPWRDLIAKARQDGRLDLAANWVDPENDNGNRTRSAAQRLIESMGPIEVASTRAGQAWKEMTASRTWKRYRWIGCLMRDESQKWTCPVHTTGADLTGDLLVFQRSAGAAPTFTKIGRLEGGRATLTLAGAQVEGRAVFVVLAP